MNGPDLFSDSYNFSYTEVSCLEDSYQGLPYKSQVIADLAHEQNYAPIVLVDDDTYFHPNIPKELLEATYWGKRNDNHGGYCCGFCYGLSEEGIDILRKATVSNGLEDVQVGQLMQAAGVVNTYTDKVILVPKVGGLGKVNWAAIPPDFIAVAELQPNAMREFHNAVIHNALKGTGPRALPGSIYRQDLW